VSIRKQRIAEQVRAEIARVLREESSDPRIGLLTVTRVKVSADLSTALVFWSPLSVENEVDLDELSDGLRSAAGFVRGHLARSLNLRRTPALVFKYDPSIGVGSKTHSLLRSLDIAPAPPDAEDAEDTEEEDGEKA
jgi:ribosome-binding factor A